MQIYTTSTHNYYKFLLLATVYENMAMYYLV